MPHYYMRLYTGPTLAAELGAKLEACPGVSKVSIGTQDIYCVAEGTYGDAAAWNVLAALQQTHGTDYGLKPVNLRIEYPQAVTDAIRRKFGEDEATADKIIANLQYYSTMGCWGFMHAGMFHGVEDDGYIHT